MIEATLQSILDELRAVRAEQREIRDLVAAARVRRATRSEAAEEYRCSIDTIDAMIARGDIRAERIGRHVRVLLAPLATENEVAAAAARAIG